MSRSATSGNKLLLPLRLLRTRLLWFLKHYGEIKYNSELFNAVHGPPVYNTDGLATSNNADFISDPRFAKAYALARATDPWPGFSLMWRVYICCWYAEQASRLEGDFVECGVNTGAYARAIIDYVHFSSLGKTFHLLDTFKGIDPRFVNAAEKQAGILNYQYRDTYEEVVRTFSGLPVNIIRGPVPDTLSLCTAGSVCYLSIDMNNTLPEIEAMNYFWPKLVPGAVILLDDYGFPGHLEQKKAFDAFAHSVNHNILSLPTGQGLMIRNQEA